MKTFKFSLVLRTRENTDVFITLDDNIYGIHNKRINILYIFSLLWAVKNIRSGTVFFFFFFFLIYIIWIFSLHEMKMFMVFTEKEKMFFLFYCSHANAHLWRH